MAEAITDFSEKEFQKIFAEKLTVLKGKARKAAKSAEDLFFEKKLKAVKSPEQLIKAVIYSVLEKQFGPQIFQKPYFEKMSASIVVSLLSNSELKNRLLKMAMKYLKNGNIDRGS